MKVEILTETDYSKFVPILGNRPINYAKVDKICVDIDSGFDMLPYCPIIVSDHDGKLNIIDGQHRYHVSVKTKKPVYYVICNTLTLKQIAMLNSRGEKWKPADFLNCYIKLGLTDYEHIKTVMVTHKVAIKTAIDLLMFFKHTESKSTDLFQSGEFQCHYLKETNDLLTLCHDLFGRYTFSNDRYLIGAVQQIQKAGKCDFTRLKQKIEASPMMMDKQNDVKHYIYNVERVYNFKNHTREVII